MYNAVYAGEKAGFRLEKVYVEEVRQLLNQKLSFIKPLITYVNFKDHKNDLKTVEYIFSTWGMPVFQEKEIREYFPSLKAVFYAAGSVQGFARPFLNCGVKVFCAAAANAVPVAEFTAAQILLADKGYFQGVIKYRNLGQQAAKAYCHNFPGNYGSKLGILGAGRIGKEVIRLLKPCNLQIFVYDPYLSAEEAFVSGVTLTGLKEIFSECQVISNHLANNAQTQGILDYNLFSKMLYNGTFINTGRGAQVAEAGLIRALKEKPDRTALLDVTFPEPPAEGSELYRMENVFLSPHIAGSMGNETQRMGYCMYEEFIAFSEGRPVSYEVIPDMLNTMA